MTPITQNARATTEVMTPRVGPQRASVTSVTEDSTFVARREQYASLKARVDRFLWDLHTSRLPQC